MVPGMKNIALLGLLFLLTSCVSSEEWKRRRELNQQRTSQQQARELHLKWRAENTDWKSKTYQNQALLDLATPENVSIEIDLSDQRGLFLVNSAVAMDFPVATGKRSHPTPAGSYTILQKMRDYASNLYGKMLDADGNVVISDADSRRHSVPEGGSFAPAKMPCWMRLTNTGIGMHIGYVPGRPASHGCIRLQKPSAHIIFDLVKLGTPVVVAQSAPSLGPPSDS